MVFKQKIYETKAEKKKDFWIGVGLFFGLNIVMGLCSWAVAAALFNTPSSFDQPTLAATFYLVLGVAPWVLNLGLIFYFGLTRSQIALGMLAGFGIAFAITLCLGLVFMAYCFYALGSGGY